MPFVLNELGLDEHGGSTTRCPIRFLEQAGFAERAGHRIKFLPFMFMAFPLMLMSIVVASVYVVLRFL